MTVDSLKQLPQFKLYTNGYHGLKRWITAKSLRQLDFQEHLDSIIESYELACELLLKHIISRTSYLRREHIHSHNVWSLACDAEIRGRDRYRTLLKRLGSFYLECRYETDNLEDKQAILDYFKDEEVFDTADELLRLLYEEARDVERSVSLNAQRGKPVGPLDLFSKSTTRDKKDSE